MRFGGGGDRFGRAGVCEGVQSSESLEGSLGHAEVRNLYLHLALLIDTQHGRIGIELYVPDDKEIGRKAIESASLFEEHLGLKAVPFDAKKASGVRFYKDGCKIKGNQNAWPGYVKQQLDWALAMREVVDRLGL